MKRLWLLILFGLASAAANGASADADIFLHLAGLEKEMLRETQKLDDLRDLVNQGRAELSSELKEAEAEVFVLSRKLEEVQRKRAETEEQSEKPLTEAKVARKTVDYLKTSLRDFTLYFQSTVHIAELESYQPAFDALHAGQPDATRGPTPPTTSRLEVWGDVFEAAIGHCETLNGGRLVAGEAVAGPDNEALDGQFALWGPLTLFGADNGRVGGYATLPPNRLKHHIIDTGIENSLAIARFVRIGSGELPVDGTQGNAALLYATRDTLSEHVSKGGPVMVGIITLGAAALFVALFKLIQVARVRRVAQADVDAILAHLKRGDEWEAMEIANRLKGPGGAVFRVGVSHYHEDTEELELALVNTVADAQSRMKAGAPFIAVAAAMAPLFGLLGTVTGMINTFRLISVYGTGDPRMLSSGISESLITTEFGLIIAVPSLLLHALVAGRIKQLVQSMESKAVRFLVNRPLSESNDDEATVDNANSSELDTADQELESPDSLNPVPLG